MTSNIRINEDLSYTMDQLASVMKNMGIASNRLTINAYKTFLEKRGYKLEEEGCIFDVDNK